MTEVKSVRRRKRRAKKNPLHGVVTEARRRRLELNRFLSEAVSEAMNMRVKVQVVLDPAESQDMKRARKRSTSDYYRALGALSNLPLKKR